MNLDLTDDETAALERLLSDAIDRDRYPLSPRIKTLRGILAKIRRNRNANPCRHPDIMNRRGRAALATMRAYSGPPMTLENAAAAHVRLIVWCRSLALGILDLPYQPSGVKM
jgi:hypothetical protein